MQDTNKRKRPPNGGRNLNSSYTWSGEHYYYTHFSTICQPQFIKCNILVKIIIILHKYYVDIVMCFCSSE